MAAETHAVMKSSLAKALIEAGVEHHDLGGLIGQVFNPIAGLIKGVGSSLTTTNPYQGQLAPTTQSDYTNAINTSTQNALDVNPQQNNLAKALLAQSQGQGPNPAQAALNQATGQNVAAQSALMAGQRGAGANVGLQSALAARQGANTEQQAVGQGATLQAQQELGAQNQLQSLYGQQQAGANQLLGISSGAQNNQNSGQVANYAQMQGINSGVAQSNANSSNQLTGGLINGGAGAAAAFLGAAEGGEVEQSGDIVSPKGRAPILPLENGGGVPGQSPHPGNDIRNDTELALLSKGEAVIPNSVMQSSDPGQKAKEFIDHLRGGKEKAASGYEKVANAKKGLKERIEHLERLCMGGRAA